MIRCAICTHPREVHEPDSFTGMAPCEGVFTRQDDGEHFAFPCGCRDFLDALIVSAVPELEGIDELA